MAKTKTIKLSAEKREGTGKGVARELRRNKMVPAVIYGDNKEPVTIQMAARDITTEYFKGGLFNNLTEILLENDKHLVLARDVQINPVTDHVLHADFLRVSPRTRIDVAVPVEFLNEETSPGLEKGGVLNVIRFEIELNCRATDIPDKVDVDLHGMEIGDTIKISSVTLPEGTQPTISDRDFTIASIAAPRALIEEGEDEEASQEEGSEAGEESTENEGSDTDEGDSAEDESR